MLFLGFWILFQLWQGGYSIVHPEAGGGVAFFAHVGGFVFGVLTVHLFKVRAPLRPTVLMGRFEDHVRAALDSLPPELARGLENVAVVVEEQNAEEPDLYGLFDEPEYLPARIADLPPAAASRTSATTPRRSSARSA